MKKSNLLLIGYASFMMLCSGTILGQQGVLLPKIQEEQHECGICCNHESHRPEPQEYIPEIDIRRASVPGDTALIKGATDINKEFGAGESMKITSGNHSTQTVSVPWSLSLNPGGGYKYVPWSSQYATSTTSSLATTPADIKLGSNESKNVVIKAYTGDGFSMGWATVVRAVNYGAGQQPQFNTPAANPIMNVSPTYNAAAFRTWSNVVPYVNTFDTVPTLVDATLNTVKAYTFSKYTYKYFMGMSYVDGVWNYNPWNATSRGNCTYSTIYGRVWPLGTDASFSGDKNPWLAPPYHSPAITNALSTCCSSTLFDMVWEADGAGGGYLWVWHHGSSGLKGLSVSQYPSVNDFHYNSGPYQANALHVGPSDTASAYYTSTIDSFYNRSWAKGYFNDNGITELSYPVDDSVALVQFSGTSMTNAEALAEQSTYMLESDAANPLGAGFNQFYGGSSATAIKNYKRPTTIFLEGDKHEFATFSISDINWYYETDSIYPHQDVANNGYFSGCCAGYMYGYTFNPNWISFYEEGKTLVDGAILLTTNAQVYIDDDIKDATLVPGSKRSGTAGVDAAPDTETAAIVVVPDSVDAGFLLRTAGSWDHMNMYQEDMSKNEKDLFYRQVTYPEPHSDIFLFEGTNTYTYSVRNLFTYNNGGAINIAAPASSGKGSVFGLFGNYIHDGANNANVHTAWGDPSTGGVTKYENPGVIEIGTGISDKNGAALAVDGYKYFNIYSGGTLKNFEGMNWATHKDPANNFAMNFTSADNTPEFILDGKEPLYILNYGSNRTVYDGTSGVLPDADINWHAAGITKLEDALTNTTDIGALQIQAAGDVHFYDAFSPTIPAGKPTELRIFSDNAGVQFLADLTYINNTDTNFVAWANGTNAGRRSCFLDTINSGSGEVLFDGVTRITQDLTGITLLRSENDDVLMSNTFYYTNLNALDDAGEFMMQAGQDIYGLGSVTFEHKGQKSILLEAKKTIHLEDALTITKTGGTTDSITLKAGYDNFSTSAVVSSWDPIANYACALQGNNYANRVPCVSPDGADIWLEGPVAVNLVNIPVDTVATTFRAFNSIYLDNTFDFERAGSGDAGAKGTGGTGRTLLFAETGNIEAIAGSGTDITFTLGDADSSLLTLQAGNQVGGICAAPTQFSCWDLNGNPGAEYDGNILFNNKLTINSEGTGNVLVSSARDIESQISADFTFTFDESGLNPGDVLLTAGRHVETHAPMLFDYKNLNDTSKITIQAGRLDGSSYECSNQLCKAIELGTALTADIYGGSATTAYDPVAAALAPVVDNTFAAGGSGHGSILAFNTIDFKYQGVDTILLTALNGNIESDPYLHGSYPGDAKITFDHQGKGVVRMEAIDIKLHDVLDYQGMHHASDSNGRFYMAAFDSILTRDLTYSNLTDNGSVYITTDKYKASASCDVPYDCTIGGPGIHQGHIVLGYAADCNNANSADKILFDFNSTVQNTNTSGANLYIQAGYEGFSRNKVTGKANTVLFSDRANDRGKGYGGNITFDFMEVYMAKGNGNTGGYAEISTPNGNIWGKDSLQYHGVNGNLLIDAGLGSLEDTLHAVRWSGFANYCQGAGSEEMLNTLVPYACGDEGEWRTGNIMLKGGSVDFTDVFSSGVSGKGNVTFRTREGFIDIYDKFNVTNMSGHYLNYAGMGGSSTKANEWGDVSVRDLEYSPVENSGSLFFGADDNIMLNYGYSNGKEPEYNILSAGLYDVVGADLVANGNPYYSTTYHPSIADCFAKFDVNENGYMWYRNGTSDDGTGWKRKYHRMYRGCSDGIQTPTCSPLTGECETIDNGARALTFNFNTLSDGVTRVKSGGLGVVATNYIDVFTAFTYHGGNGTGLHSVPGMTTLKGESVSGYGLYMKSTFDGTAPEKRRVTCEGCGGSEHEWTYIGFHDNARIHTNNQKSLLEAPVIEFFGHAELDAYTQQGTNTRLTLKADSLIFHDSAIFDGNSLELLPYTTVDRGMQHGIVSDDDGKFYRAYGKAITMNDRQMPVLELGYQRCYEPEQGINASPNLNSTAGKESTPLVGGDIIVAFKHAFSMPIFNTIVANHARISFISDSIDKVKGGEYIDACLRTDLLRIRNKVEFYTDPTQPIDRRGTLKMTSSDQMVSVIEAGIYPKHIHTEPGSELSIPGEDSLVVIATTTVGGYGKIHENIMVKANGILAPGFASLMEVDCQSGENQGRFEIHNLKMEDHAILRISMSQQLVYNPDTKKNEWTMTPDTLIVHDSIYMSEKVQLQVLSDFDAFLPGCYLFFIYDDSDDESKEYVKNLSLQTTRYGDYHLALDFSEPGRVYLCVTEYPTPVIQRYIHIHSIEGVTTNPVSDEDHFVIGHKDFTFAASYASGTPLEVMAKSVYSKSSVKLVASYVSDGVYEYTLHQVVQPWNIYFGSNPDTEAGGVGNDGIHTQRVWSHMNILYVNVEKEDVVSIYNMTGVLYKKLEIPAGLKTLTLERGIYVVTLKDGSVHKIVIK